MALNLKNATVERLAAEAARRLGVSKSEAVRRALEAQLERISWPSRAERAAQLVALLERDVWPFVPDDAIAVAGAYATYGRGRHAASLDFGDRMSYAVARLARAPLPFVGNDFSQTDLEPALTT